jgi:hypothetical protein
MIISWPESKQSSRSLKLLHTNVKYSLTSDVAANVVKRNNPPPPGPRYAPPRSLYDRGLVDHLPPANP